MKKFFLTILLFLILFILYGVYIDTNSFKVTTHTISNEKLPESFNNMKIVHLSDFLIDNNNIHTLNKIVKKVNSLNPDVIFLLVILLKVLINIMMMKKN